MAKPKRLRIFVGPNGSGKSTLFENISKNFNTGHYINSDLIEQEISKNGFVNLDEYGLSLSEQDLSEFYERPSSISLLRKSHSEGHTIDIELKKNVIVDKSRDTHSYEASLITAFIRYNLMKKGFSYSFESVMSHPSKLDEIRQTKL